MLTLPPALATLSKLVAKPNSPRYPTTAGVCVATTDSGWEAAATDFNRMLLVSGPHLDPKPDYSALTDAPNGATAGSLPAKWWADVFGGAKKVRGIPGVGLVLSDGVATASNGTTSTRTETIQGKLAPFADIIPKRTSDVGCVIRFDANLMAGLLKSLADLSDDGNDPVVTMEIRRPANSKSQDKALVIRADYPAEGMSEVTGMLQPCAPKGDENGQSTRFYSADSRDLGDQSAPDEQGQEEFRAEVERLRVALAGAEQGHVQQADVIRILEEQIERQAAGYRTLADTYDHVKAENAKLRDETEHGNELAGLWGRLGDAERTARDAVAESERLRAELDALAQHLADARGSNADLRAEVQRLRNNSTLPARRTLGQLAAVRKDGE